MGIFKNGRVEIIANDQGNRITPSYVAFTAEGERLIGDAAKNQLTSNPENTVFDAKRLIGREFKDPSVQSDIKHFPFTVIERKNKPTISISIGSEQKFFEPEEISAMVLGKMREIAVRKSRFLLLIFILIDFIANRKPILAIKSHMLLSLFQLTSTMLNVKQPKMLVPSRA